jgi:hypothetical protein
LAATAWADDGPAGFESAFGQNTLEAAGGFDQASDVIEREFAVGIKKSVVTDFHEAGGQHVLEEAADELHNFKGESS